jgi:hypothetical protein
MHGLQDVVAQIVQDILPRLRDGLPDPQDFDATQDTFLQVSDAEPETSALLPSHVLPGRLVDMWSAKWGVDPHHLAPLRVALEQAEREVHMSGPDDTANDSLGSSYSLF